MNQKTFSLVASVIFSLITLGHLLRLVFGWVAAIGGWTVPMWASGIALVVIGFLAYQGFRVSRNGQD